jgi:RND family efflux transporter MFP subunit
VLALCFPLVLPLLGCSPPAAAPQGDEKPTEDAAMRVSVIAPQKKTLIRRTEQPGQVRALEETPIFAKVTGFVSKVRVDIGDAVHGPKVDEKGNVTQPGDVLLEVEAPELQEDVLQKTALVAQAKSQITQAEAAIKVAKAAKESATAGVAEAEAAVDRAEAVHQQAKSEMDRVNELFQNKASTQKLVDEAQSRLQAAAAARKEVAAKITSARSQVTEKEAGVEQADADLNAAKSRLDVAQAEERRAKTWLQYLVVRAPYDGTVIARNVDTGHLVQPGKNAADKPLLVVVQADTVRVLVDVPEGDATLVQAGSDVSIRTPAAANATIKGQVKRSAWVLQPATRTLRVEVDVPNKEGKLRPGMYVYADVKVAERKDAMALPKGAVLVQDNQSFCLTVDSASKIVRLPIQIGIRAGDEVEVLSGLSGSERVIATNVTAYREGQTVEIVPAAAK